MEKSRLNWEILGGRYGEELETVWTEKSLGCLPVSDLGSDMLNLKC